MFEFLGLDINLGGKRMKCSACDASFGYKDSDIRTESKSAVWSTKFLFCPKCGNKIILEVNSKPVVQR